MKHFCVKVTSKKKKKKIIIRPSFHLFVFGRSISPHARAQLFMLAAVVTEQSSVSTLRTNAALSDSIWQDVISFLTKIKH